MKFLPDGARMVTNVTDSQAKNEYPLSTAVYLNQIQHLQAAEAAFQPFAYLYQ